MFVQKENQSYEYVKLKLLIGQLKNVHKYLKSCYEKSLKDENPDEISKVIYNNYYILDNKIKLMTKYDKALKVATENILTTQLGEAILNACEKDNLPDKEKLVAIISSIQNDRYITNTEFELLEWQFSYTVIIKFSMLFSPEFESKFFPTELISLLSKSDVLSQSEYIEALNPLEKIYSNDPAKVYTEMDEVTRQIYRERTSFIATKKKVKENEVANKIIDKANKAKQSGLNDIDCHIGNFIYKEYDELKKSYPESIYYKLLFIIPIILSVFLAYLCKNFWLSLLFYFPMWEISKTVIDYIYTRSSEITYLPRMKYNNNIPDPAKSLVVISTVLTSPKDMLKIKSKLKSLYFLCNAKNLKICLLCDYLPSKNPKMPEDVPLLKALTKIINSLNEEHHDSFNAIIRNRVYSKTENKFIGYERKRGAIEQLIGYIKNKNSNDMTILGDKSNLVNVKYLVALDYDTKPLMGTTSELINIALHPLNKPYIVNGTVVKGYGIIAPKISTQLESSLKSPFSRLFGGIGSSCAYDVRCGNLYQDCFHESIFAGKGLIDVDSYYALCYKKLPDDCILSHDILEGSLLRTAFAGDVEFSDSFPTTIISYFKRMHRWIRGDIQNSVFISKQSSISSDYSINPLSDSNRFKLFDNVRRSITPILTFALFVITLFLNANSALIAVLAAVSSIIIPYLWGIACSIKANGYYSISRKYYSSALSTTKSLLAQMFFNFMLLPQQAIISLDAVIRALWRRFVIKKKLLEWTTAAQADTRINSTLKNIQYFTIAEIICLIIFVFSPYPFTRFLGMILSLMPFVAFFSSKQYIFKRNKITTEKRGTLSADAAAMWQYYEDYANKENNYLPPDNVQFSPIYRICKRTSPTNIGMMLLSILAAKDFDLIDAQGLYLRIDRTLSSVEKMKKYHGNLYNWYDTETLKISPNPFVSSVDSGNFLCCLTALKEGLKEYQYQEHKLGELIERIEKLINNADIGIFYNNCKNLFSIGINPENGEKAPNHYDMLMSEARMLSYFAIARRVVPKKHWRCLARTMKRNGRYSGSVSYSGTMFEFFMPELLLKSSFGSLCYESLKFCIHCQYMRGKSRNVPFGISESAFYAFDNQLNYQYKAHGVQNAGISRGLNRELVVSPYSSYLSMQSAFDISYQNLQALKKYSTYGPYGFYEAIDFTQNRANATVIKSYMAHHVGMSIVALDNSLMSGKMQKRFMRDSYMASASELLDEKVLSGSVIYDDVRENEPREADIKNAQSDFMDYFSVSNPNVKLLTNGDYTLCASDLGSTISIYQEKDVFTRTTDLLRRPAGCYFALQTLYGTQYLTYLPTYSDGDISCEFKDNYVSYYSNTDKFETGMKLYLHSSLPCEYKEIAIKNLTTDNQKVSLLCYFEPILMNFLEFEAHPAFMKFFIEIEIDKSTDTVIICRRERNSSERIYCAIGFTDAYSYSYNFNREDVLTFPYGTTSAFFKGTELPENPNHIPDPCVFLSLKLSLQPKEQKNVKLFVTTAMTKDALYSNIVAIKNQRRKHPMHSLVVPSSVEGRLASSILPQILYKKHDSNENDSYISKNTLCVRELWALGISGDIPIICVEISHHNEEQKVLGYVKCHKILKLCGIHFDLVFIYSEKPEQKSHIPEMITDNVIKFSSYDFLKQKGGIHFINSVDISEELLTLVYATAVHIAPKAMDRIGSPAIFFKPVEILPVSPQNVYDNGFEADNEVKISRKTDVPWCHNIANPVFGTMVSNSSLGFTFAVNSRENKLTPWYNDTKTDNRGEMLILFVNNKYYDIVLGSEAVFSEGKALYYGKTEEFNCIVDVSISQYGFCKKVSVEIEWLSDTAIGKLCFYTEPVLGVSRNYTRTITVEESDNVLLFRNPYNSDIKGYMAISSNKEIRMTTDREAILSGKWDEESKSSRNNLCGAMITSTKFKTNKKYTYEFYISFGFTKASALAMPSKFDSSSYEINENVIKINTPDNNLNIIFNSWLPQQFIYGRMFSRTGFYQNSGAYGFRDQLQDSCGALLINPDITKRQIIKACTSQFIEGDVLHWWHRLPQNVIRGVRTRYSDDLLWLPYTVCEYIEKTTDYSILKTSVAYAQGDILTEGQHENYITVSKSDVKESVYSHCKRAINKSRNYGEHGLLLMGCGDWNDGYNGVGINGRGESVWLTQFFCIILDKFSKLADYAGETELSVDFASTKAELMDNIDKNAWDGEWYLRAYFDDGTPLGSHDRKECSIDSLSQSFAELSSMPDKSRVYQALENAYLDLVDKKGEIISLFTPPFYGKDRRVGYVSAYPAGIRENGGQYTHGAIWFAAAMLKNGQTERGYELIKMLNPLEKYENKVIANRYKNEPYYMSADIYTNPQCYGRGGWSIYTGAASWYYRVIFEWMLGIKINGTMTVNPMIPKEWNEYSAEIVYKNTAITLKVKKGDDCGLFDNGIKCDEILFDGKKHDVVYIIKNQ